MLNKKKKNNKGFTLVELLVVIAIIGILAVVAVPALFSNINKAKATDVVADVRAIKTAVMAQYADGSDISTLNGKHNGAQGDIASVLEIQDFSGEGQYVLNTNAAGEEAGATITVTVNSEDIAKRVASQLGIAYTPATGDNAKVVTITVPILGQVIPPDNNR